MHPLGYAVLAERMPSETNPRPVLKFDDARDRLQVNRSAMFRLMRDA